MLLNPNELLGMVDVEPGVKISLPTVEAIEANKIDKFLIKYIANSLMNF